MNKLFNLLLAVVLLMAIAIIVSCSVSPSKNSSGGSASSAINLPPWDWNGIIGTGQSLEVGGPGGIPASSTNQPYGNLKLSLGSATVPPWDPTNKQFSMVPLVELIRPMTTWPIVSYPSNIYGETPHTAMADEITALVLANSGSNYVTVHTVVGEAGQPISVISKGAQDTGTSGRAYVATIFEAQAISLLAKEAGKKYGIQAIVITHGESDNGNSMYEGLLELLWADYNSDLKAVTGQTNTIPMFVSQQESLVSNEGYIPIATQMQWRIGVDYPGVIVCTGPKYQYPYYSDGVHLINLGYDMYGEKLGEIYYQKVIQGQNWQPLQPTNVVMSSNLITVLFNVPVLPLRWDTNIPLPHQISNTQWSNGQGFEVYTSSSNYTINTVAISGNSVLITCAGSLPTNGLYVGYAMTSDGVLFTNGTYSYTYRSGQLCDSDPFVGFETKIHQPNYCVSFYWDIN